MGGGVGPFRGISLSPAVSLVPCAERGVGAERGLLELSNHCRGTLRHLIVRLSLNSQKTSIVIPSGHFK